MELLTQTRLIPIVSTALILSACGGGGGDSGSNPSPAPTPNPTPTYSIQVNVSDGGTVDPMSATVSSGGSATFEFTPDDGFLIGSVQGCGGTLNGTSYRVTDVSANCTIDAVFERETVTITTNVSSGGRLSPETQDVKIGDMAQVTVEADTGFRLAQINGCNGELNGDIYQINAVTESCTIDATFSAQEFLVSSISNNGGAVEPESALVPFGGSVSFTLVPESGFAIEEVTGCGGTLSDTTYTIENIIADCEFEASFYQLSTITLSDYSVMSGDRFVASAIVDENSSYPIVNYRWALPDNTSLTVSELNAQVNAFEVLLDAPFLAQAATETISLIGEDTLGNTIQANAQVTILPLEQTTVAFSPNVSLPQNNSNIDVSELDVLSGLGESNAMPNNSIPSLIYAKDDDGLVFLSIASSNERFFDESGDAVNVDIDSTMTVVVGLASGRSVASINTEFVSSLQSDSRYGLLIEMANALINDDKNFLEKFDSYPDIVNEIREIAKSYPYVGNATAVNNNQLSQKEFVERQKHLFLLNSSLSSASDIDVVEKSDFYCFPLTGWPCSPWDTHESKRWGWYGSASGIEAFEQDNSTLLNFALNVFIPQRQVVLGYTEVLQDAATVPFIAKTLNNTDVTHAMANPGFMNYSMEAYSGNSYTDWMLVPRNSTLIQKLLNSGAAYREFSTNSGEIVNSSTTSLRFNRYRDFGISSGNLTQRAAVTSLINNLHLVISAFNLVSDASAVSKYLDKLAKEASNNSSLFADLAICGAELVSTVDIYDLSTGSEETLRASGFIEKNAASIFETLLTSDACQDLTIKGGVSLTNVILQTKISAVVDTKVTALTLGLKLGFDALNDFTPVVVSYFSSAASDVEYSISWRTEGDNYYIDSVSRTKLPYALIQTEQISSSAIQFSAAESTVDSSSGMSFEWYIDDELISTDEIFLYQYSQSGSITVELVVEDDFGNAKSTAIVVDLQLIGPIDANSLVCHVNDNKLIMNLNVPVGSIQPNSISWFSSLSSINPFNVTLNGELGAEISVDNGEPRWAKARIDFADGSEILNCFANMPVEDRFIDTEDGLIVDITNGVMWQACSFGQDYLNGACIGDSDTMNWLDSYDYSKSISFQGFADWRIPTDDELNSLVYCESGLPAFFPQGEDRCSSAGDSPTVIERLFPNTPSEEYWSSSIAVSGQQGGDHIFTTDFSNGEQLVSSFGIQRRLRLVRDIEPKDVFEVEIGLFAQAHPFTRHKATALINGEVECLYHCSILVSKGDTISIRALNVDVAKFSRWYGDCSGNEDTCVLEVNSDLRVFGYFARDDAPAPTNTLKVKVTGDGAVSNSDLNIYCVDDCEFQFGTNLLGGFVDGLADEGATFVSWGGDCQVADTTTPSCNFSLTGGASIEALFTNGQSRELKLEACNVWSAAQSGGFGETVDKWDISSLPNNVIFDIRFNTFSVPDKFQISYDGNTVWNSGWRGDSSYEGDPLYPGGIAGPGNGQRDNLFIKSNKDEFIVITNGVDNNTQWEYEVRCR